MVSFFDWLKYIRLCRQLFLHNTSSEGENWYEFTKYHRYCKKHFLKAYEEKYSGSQDIEVLNAIRSYRKNKIFTYYDTNTEILCQKIYDKLKIQGFVDSNFFLGNCRTEDPNQEIGYDGSYTRDAYIDFPEVEKIFQGKVGEIIRGIFECNFDIFYSVLFKTEHDSSDMPSGSQLWHSDGGPSTCMNLFFFLTDVSEDNGGTEILPWSISKQVYRDTYLKIQRKLKGKNLSKVESRNVKSFIFEEEIEKRHTHSIIRLSHPRAGLVAGMNNNNLHKGGFTKPNNMRIVLISHIYPISEPTPFEMYRSFGRRKISPIPNPLNFSR